MRWWLIIGAGAVAASLAGGGVGGRLFGALVRELARAVT